MRSFCCLRVFLSPESRNSRAKREDTLSGRNEYMCNNRINVGCGVFYAVRVVFNNEYVEKSKQAMISSQNFLF
jgi:hypothetical protein